MERYDEIMMDLNNYIKECEEASRREGAITDLKKVERLIVDLMWEKDGIVPRGISDETRRALVEVNTLVNHLIVAAINGDQK